MTSKFAVTHRLAPSLILLLAAACTDEVDRPTVTHRYALDGGADMNSPPDAVDDQVTVDEDDSVVIDVLANDSDADGHDLTLFVSENAREGALTRNPDDTFTYEPRRNYNGEDSFTYRVLDGYGGEGIAQVMITVTPVNDPPNFTPPTPPHMSTLTVVANETLEFQMAAGDIDGDELTFGYDEFETLGDPPVVQDDTFTWTPGRFDLGVTFIRIFVTDGTERDERDLTVEIVEPADQICGQYRCNGTDVCFHDTCFPSCQRSADCGPDEACFDGRCAESACEGRSCEEGLSCFAGGCFPDCSNDVVCSPGERCWGFRCAEESCEEIVCESGSVCVGGSCRAACEDTSECETGSCFSGGCASTPCEGVVCPAGQRCDTGECVPDCAVNDEGDCAATDDDDDGPAFESGGCGCSSSAGLAEGSLLFLIALLAVARRLQTRT